MLNKNLDTWFLALGILQLIILSAQSKDLIWDKRQEKFVELFSVPIYAALPKLERNNSIQKTLKLHGEVIKVTYYEERNMAMFYDNDTKVTGIFGEVCNLIADYLNFTLVPVKYEKRDFGVKLANGSYTGLLDLLHRNEVQMIMRTGMYIFRFDQVDYSMPIYKTRYHLYIRPEYKYDNAWIITLFARDTWYAVVAVFLVLSVSGYLLQRAAARIRPVKRPSDRLTLVDHVFQTYALMCAQGYVPDNFYKRFKILSVSKSLFAWMVFLAFSSHLIYRMTNRTVTLPFENMTDMFRETNYKFLGFKGSMIYESLMVMIPDRFKGRTEFFGSASEMHRSVCFSNNPEQAFFEANDKFLASNKFVCDLTAVGPGYYETWISFALQKGFRYRQFFDASLIKLQEVGLMDALMDRWLTNRPEVKKRSKFKTIDLNQVHIILMILFFGFGMSVFVLILEHICFVYEQRHKF